MTIGQAQNDESHLIELAAQRQIYSKAKIIFSFQILLSVICVSILSVLTLFMPEMKTASAIYALVMALLNQLLFSPWIKNLRITAAVIQESFDCQVLSLPWNFFKAKDLPDPEILRAYFLKYQRKHPDWPDGLTEWYPNEVDELPIELGRVLCQRFNGAWDKRLRKYYSIILWTVFAVSIGLIVLIGLWGEMTLTALLTTVAAPVTPILLLGISQLREHKDSTESAQSLQSHAETLLYKVSEGHLSSSQALQESRMLQDLIFDHRRSNPLIFDCFYMLFRTNQQDEMSFTADSLIKTFKSTEKTVQPDT